MRFIPAFVAVPIVCLTIGCERSVPYSDSVPTPPSSTEPSASSPKRGIGTQVSAPDVRLSTPEGVFVNLADALGSGPVVVIFYRGGWCPFCTGHLSAWQDRLAELDSLGASLIAITPERPDRVGAGQAEHNYGFAVLSDAQGEAARAFDLQFTIDAKTRELYQTYDIDLSQFNASGTWDMVIPATYVIDSGGVIRYAYVNEDYRTRAEVDDVLEAVRSLP
ncbi:MAG: AhpC/TSA family protein [Phycisphaeraceae bacterium]|nr:AhpC/TSA family protein [Phycisphaeraceae bacterium]MCW5762648.1 AhpC/TSA family protein [Phycisphaeraceae bacterium]